LGSLKVTTKERTISADLKKKKKKHSFERRKGETKVVRV
jgi:hypothetical protein